MRGALRTLNYDGEVTLPLINRTLDPSKFGSIYGLAGCFTEGEVTEIEDARGNALVPVSATYYPLRHQTRVTFEVRSR